MEKINKKFKLTELLVKYRSADEKEKFFHYLQLYNEMCLYIYFFPIRFSLKNKEEICSEFLLHMEAKIKDYIHNFKYTNVPIEYYLNVTLKYQLFTFQKEYYNKLNKNAIYEKKDVYHVLNMPTLTHEPMMVYQENQEDETIGSFNVFLDILTKNIVKPAQKRRFSWFILKYSPLLQKSQVYSLLNYFNIKQEDFNVLYQKIQAHNNKRRQSLERLKEKRNLYFTKSRLLEARLENEETHYENKSAVMLKLEDNQKKYREYCSKIERYNISIPNSFLAKLLGVPKGTIDSGIFHFYRQCRKHYPKFIQKKRGLDGKK